MLNNIKNLGKDSFFYGSSSIIGQISGIILVPFLTIELSPLDYGVLAMIGTLSAFAGPISGLALDTGLFRFFTIDNLGFSRQQYFTTAAIAKLVSTSIFSIVFLLLYNLVNINIFKNYLHYSTYLIVVLTFWIDGFSSLSITLLRSERKAKLIAINNIIIVLGGILLTIFFVVFLKRGIEGAVWAYFFTAIIKLVLYIKVSKNNFHFKCFNFRALRELLNYSLPLLPHKIQGNITGVFTMFMINHNLGLLYTGYFSLATKVAKPFSMIVTTVQQSWTPFKFHIHNSETNPSRTFSELINFYWLFLIVVYFVVAQLSPFIFEEFVDERFHGAIPYVPFLMSNSLFLAFYFTVTTGFELDRNQNPIVLSSLVPMLFVIVSSLLFIDFYKPYIFFVIQSLAPLISAFIIYPRAKKMIIIDYKLHLFVILFIITIFAVYGTYQTQNGLVVFILSNIFIASVTYVAIKIYSVERLILKLGNLFSLRLKSTPNKKF